MKKILLIIYILIGTLCFAQSGESSEWIEGFLNDEAVINSPYSICVSNLDSNETLLDVNSNLSIIPASTLKLITTATALKLLGPNFKFETTIWHNGSIVDGVLYGDLCITGGADPTLGSEYMFGQNKNAFLQEWLAAVKTAGIKSIAGNIVVDPSIFNDQDVPQTWIWEDLGNYFGAAAQGIALYDNTFKIFFETDDSNGGETKITGTDPFIPNIDFTNYVRASNDPRDRAFVYGNPFDSKRIIKGTLPKGRSDFQIKASIPDPSYLLAYEFQKALWFDSITISGDILKKQLVVKDSIPVNSIIKIWKSPELQEIIKTLNYESVNLFAEHLCKYIGLTQLSDGSTKSGTKAIKSYWKKEGFDTEVMYLADGSGLSRANAISAKTLVDVLSEMQNDSILAESFLNSIPKTGMDGTQRYYFQNSFLKGKASAKSGSMTRVRSFAGYMTTQKGTNIAFAIIINNFNCGSFKMAGKMEKLIADFY